MAKNILLSFILFAFLPSTYAATIKGRVTDKNGEEIIGAIVKLDETKLYAVTGLDGSFTINKVPVGKYEIQCKFVGYKKEEKNITVLAPTDILTINIVMKEDVKELKEATIVGKANVETDEHIRRTEAKADNILNMISAKAIQVSPDLTVANVLQRVSGVSVERNSSGDAQYAIIRGMDKRYNYTLVNGIKIPSPDNKNRYVPMDIFPSELLERLEVIKALTPAMEGDAIGGAMNMVMKNAPDKFLFTANAATGYSQLFFDRPFSQFNAGVINQKSPAEMNAGGYNADANKDFTRDNLQYTNITPKPNTFLGASIGNRFLNNKFGVIVAGSYQNSYRGTNSNVILPSAQPLPAPNRNSNMIFNYDDIQARQYSVQQTRQGIHTKMDYKINGRNTLSLYGVAMGLGEIMTRHIVDTASGPQRSGVGTGEIHELDRSRVTKQAIYNVTLQGNHDLLSNLRLNWSAVYSLATSKTPDWADMERIHGVSLDSNGVSRPATATTLNKMTRRWSHNEDADKTVYLNLIHTPTELKGLLYNEITIPSDAKGFKKGMHVIYKGLYNSASAILDGLSKVEFTIGGMYRMKHRDNYYISYDLTPINPATGSYPIWSNIYDANFQFIGLNKGQGSAADPNKYSADENISARYIQAKFDIVKNLQVLGGVRIEQTAISYTTAADPNKVVGANGKKSYRDILPSVHLKYALSKKQNLRLSYFASISRPGFFEIIPYDLPGEYFNEIGNPYLKHTTANNIDLRYEFFPKGADQILAGVFYKNITNPIEYGFLQTGTSSQAIQPQNYGNATNTGFECLITKYFGLFGIRANYTYTNSSITTSKKLYYRADNGSLTYTLVDQTRPLQGQSAHIGNFSFLYRDGKRGIDAQLALVYTGRRISQLSPFYGLDYWQRAITQLDFSAEKKIHKKLYIFAKINNLLNSPLVIEVLLPNTYRTGRQQIPGQDSDKSITVQKDYYFQTYLLGVRYKFD